MKKQFNRMKQLANQTVGRRVRRARPPGVARAGGRGRDGGGAGRLLPRARPLRARLRLRPRPAGPRVGVCATPRPGGRLWAAAGPPETGRTDRASRSHPSGSPLPRGASPSWDWNCPSSFPPPGSGSPGPPPGAATPISGVSEAAGLGGRHSQPFRVAPLLQNLTGKCLGRGVAGRRAARSKGHKPGGSAW